MVREESEEIARDAADNAGGLTAEFAAAIADELAAAIAAEDATEEAYNISSRSTLGMVIARSTS